VIPGLRSRKRADDLRRSKTGASRPGPFDWSHDIPVEGNACGSPRGFGIEWRDVPYAASSTPPRHMEGYGVTSAGRDIRLAETIKSAASHETPAVDTTVAPPGSEAGERMRARRLALLLMAASSLFVLAVLGAIWYVI
jgi:hypothetical protein